MISAIRLLVTAAALLVSTQISVTEAVGMPGGYSVTKLTPELSSLLVKSLADEKVYSSRVRERVCVTKIASVEQQVVAGMNYRFTASACDVRKTLLLNTNAEPKPAEVTKQLGKCAANFAADCVEVQATVTVYRSFDESVKVSSIVLKEEDVEPALVHTVEV